MGFKGANSATQRLLSERFHPLSPGVLKRAKVLALTMTLALLGCQGGSDSGNSKKLSSPADVDNLSAINIANVSRYGLGGSCRDVEGELRVFLINEGSSQEVKSDPLDCSSEGVWAVELDATSLDEGTIKVVVSHEHASASVRKYSQGEVVKDVTAPLAPTIAIASKVNQSNFRQYGLGGNCGEEGQVVGVELGDSATTTNVARPEEAVICSSGAWSAEINTTSLLDGAIRITLSLKDIAGNPGTATIASKKDIVPPTVQVTTFAPYVVLSTQAAYALSGTCSEAQREVRVSLANPSDASTAVTPSTQPRCQGNDTWATTVNASTFSEGSLAITVSHQDDVGNEQSHSQTVTKDTVVPTTLIFSSGPLSVINLGNVSAYSLSGTCSEGDRVITLALTDSAEKTASPSETITCPSSGGNWSAQIDASSLADGNVTASAQYSDVAGNVKVAAPQTVVKNMQLPTASISASVPNILAATQASYSVSGTCSENGQSVTVTLSGGGQMVSPSATVSCNAQQWTASFNATALSEGNVEISATTQNSLGTPSASVTKTVIKDITPPTALAFGSGPLPTINLGNVSAYSLSGTCSEGDRVITLALTDSAEKTASPSETITCPSSGGNWSAQIDASSLAEGTVTASAQYSDVAGNVKVAAPQTAVKDTQRPTVSISASAPNILAATKAGYSVSGVCSENGQSVTVTLADGSKMLSPNAAVSCSSKQWTAGFDASSLAEGNVAIAVATRDVAGNASAPVVKTVVKDIQLPTLSLAQGQPTNIALSNSAQYVLQGSCGEEGQVVGVELRDSAGAANIARPAAAVTCTSGSWRAEINSESLRDGAISIVLSFVDQAGNPAAIAAIDPVVKDAVAPWVTVNAPRHIFGTTGTAVSYQLQGGCSEEGRDVEVTVATIVQTVSCQRGAWTANFSIPDSVGVGSVAITVSHLDSLLNAATFSPISVERSSSTVQISLDSAPIINRSNMGSYTLAGDCTPDGGAIALVLGGVSKTPSCASSRWSASFNFSSLNNVADSDALALTLSYAAGGNQAPLVSTTVIKDTLAPQVTLMAADSINKMTKNYYVVSGECSENTRPVILSVVDSVATALGVDRPPICSSGEWSLGLNVSSLAEGSVTLSATLADRVGNEVVTPDKVVVKNTQIPVVSISESVPNILVVTTQVSYSVSGTCSENGQSVTVTLSGGGQTVSSSATVSCNAQQWTASFNATALSEGNVEISATTQNSLGTPSASVTKIVIKDITPPTALAFGSGPLPTINLDNVSAYSLSGTCSEGDRVITLVLTDSAEKTASPSETITCPTSGGNWSAQIDATSLADGTVTASAQYSDVAGNVKVAAPQTAVKGTQRPTVGISASAPNILAATQASYSVSGACSENGQSVTVTLADGSKTLSPSAAVSCSSKQWTAGFDASSLAEGNVTIAAAIQDSAENASLEVVKNIVKDVTLPTLTLSQNQLPAINASNLSNYALSGTCSEQGQEVTLQIENSQNGLKSNRLTIATQPSCASNGQWSLQVDASGLADTAGRGGTYVVSITITHSDQAGNSRVLSARTTKDSTMPTVQITTFAPYIMTSTQAAYAISGTCSEEQREITVSLVNASDVATTATPSTQPVCQTGDTWTTMVNASTLGEGAITIAVRHKDGFENEQTHSQTVTKDTLVPNLAINALSVINVATPAATLSAYPVTGTCSEGERAITVSLTDSAGVVVSPGGAINCSSSGGNWSAQLAISSLADGTLTASARYSDVAGNVRIATPQTVAKDTQLPVLTVRSLNNIFTLNQGSFFVGGTCSEIGKVVTIRLTSDGAGAGVVALDVLVPQNCTASGGVNGEWRVTGLNVSTLRDGTITITASQEDDAQNSGSITQTVSKASASTVGITVSLPPHINKSNAGSYSLSGSCSPDGQNLSITVGNVSPGAAVTCLSSSWTATFNLSLLVDSPAVAIVASYPSGSQTATYPGANVIKDVSDPQLTLSAPGNIDRINAGSYALAGTCSEVSRVISITLVDSNSTTVNSQAICVNKSSNKQWTKEIDAQTLGAGIVTVTATHSDEAGNVATRSPTVSRSDVVIITISSNQPNIQPLNEESYLVSGTCSELTKMVVVTFVDSDNTNTNVTAQATCTNYAWTTAGVDISGASDGSMEIRALHRAVNATAVTVSKLSCVASDIGADSSIGTSAENPIIICNYNGLKAIAIQGLGKHYKLGRDIDAQASWSEGAADCGAYNGTDIATESPCKGMTQLGSFTGSLDGDGHIIKRLYLHNGGGLFSTLEGVVVPGLIKNVHLRELRVVDTNSSDSSYTGGLTDSAKGTSPYSVIDSCSVQGKISGSGNVGGLAGSSTGEIYNSYADVEVRGKHAGGLVGNIGHGKSRMVSSYARGSVQGSGGYSLVGGLAGIATGAVIRNSYADVAVSQGSHQGSIAGSFNGTISKSYGVGRVSGTGEHTGGLLGGVAYIHDGAVLICQVLFGIPKPLAKLTLTGRTVSPLPMGV